MVSLNSIFYYVCISFLRQLSKIFNFKIIKLIFMAYTAIIFH